jgi:hypothetical protein
VEVKDILARRKTQDSGRKRAGTGPEIVGRRQDSVLGIGDSVFWGFELLAWIVTQFFGRSEQADGQKSLFLVSLSQDVDGM